MVLGIVALCQPWSLFLHRYGVTDHRCRPDRLHDHRQDPAREPKPTAGREAGAGGRSMTQIELRGVAEVFRRRPGHQATST